jgi:3-oxocholest-4-en-26-oyl-CoA dehydrogenase alpha subunit
VEFSFNEEQIKLRNEVQQFLKKELPANWVGYVGTTGDDSVAHVDKGWELFKEMARKMGEKKWLSINWPKEYGGLEKDYVSSIIFFEEIARYGSLGFNAIGAKMFAPTLIKHGTAEQKEQFLKPIAEGKEFWCEGFSEPEAGSDLASLQTRARKDGDYYIVNGQKIWATFSSYSDHCALLCRTDPDSKRHKGLSFLMVDLNTPGITVRPIANLLDEPHFGEIFFEDVKIHKSRMLGQEGEGWLVAQSFLSFERVAITPISAVNTMVEKLSKFFKENPELEKPEAKSMLANMAMEAEIGRLLCYQVAWMQDKGTSTEWHAAMSRLYGTRMWKKWSAETINLLGLYGQLDERDKRAPMKGWLENLYFSSIGATLAAGSSEIQKIVIAVRGMGLGG